MTSQNRDFPLNHFPVFVLLSITLLLPACAIQNILNDKPVERPSVQAIDVKPTGNNNELEGWWHVSFLLTWPDGADINWYLDDFIADKIIQPVFEPMMDKVRLWRFHRRAARDETGHRFSFIFYSKADTADDLITAIMSDPDLKVIDDAGLLRHVEFSDTQSNTQPNIEDTSDKAWSSAVQKTWPYYIEGVSKMWLGLIDEFVKNEGGAKSHENAQDELNLYRKIESKIISVWRTEGNHAYLHHLNALFAYKETIIIERKLKQF
jgi:hypothetical protein